MVQSTRSPISWLLLRDGHAVPIFGLSPEELKESCRATIKHAGCELKHTSGLNAIVHCLGFDGDFGDYKTRHWKRVRHTLAEHGLREYGNLFKVPTNDLTFQGMERQRRSLADRLFLGPKPMPRRVFTGYGHDWEAWDKLFSEVGPGGDAANSGPVPTEPEAARKWIYRHRTDLYGNLNFFSDHLLDLGEPGKFEAATYFLKDVSEAERRRVLANKRIVVEAFRQFIDQQQDGWLEIIPLTDNLALLKGPDGTYDLVWRNLRMSPPPSIGYSGRFMLDPRDTPGFVWAEQDFTTWNYFRKGGWDEKERHEAEQFHYAQGGKAGEDYPGEEVILERLLQSRGMCISKPRFPKATVAPNGFREVNLPDNRVLFVSEMVTVGEFRRFAEATDYMERREGESWSAANDSNPDSSPVGATFSDALAYCAWKEKELGIAVRFLTIDEHRMIRPFASEHYERLAQGDFPWENWPPRERLEASVIWSEPRFLEPGPDLPEFPPDTGRGTKSRKRWIESENYPPSALWREPLPWIEYSGLPFIDAWDAYEWCVDGRVAGRYWQGTMGDTKSWGEYKNVKIGFRLVIEADNS